MTGEVPGEQLCWSEPWMRFSARTPCTGRARRSRANRCLASRSGSGARAVECGPQWRSAVGNWQGQCDAHWHAGAGSRSPVNATGSSRRPRSSRSSSSSRIQDSDPCDRRHDRHMADRETLDASHHRVLWHSPAARRADCLGTRARVAWLRGPALSAWSSSADRNAVATVRFGAAHAPTGSGQPWFNSVGRRSARCSGADQ
jgi:hypothetical protein